MRNFDVYLKIQTDPPIFEMKPETFYGGAQIVERLIITDSIFNFFPYGELSFQDPVGLGIEAGGPIEECKFSIEFGSENTNSMLINLSLERVDYPQVFPEYSIRGTVLFYLKSYYANFNTSSKTIYTGNLSSAIQRVASNLGITSFNISDLNNSGNWLQGGKRIKEFILSHSNYASSISNTPVFSFINQKGEFFFSTLQDLFAKELISTIPYRLLSSSEDSPDIMDFNRITGLQVAFLANKKNDNNYSKSITYIDKDSIVTTSSVTMSDVFSVNMQGVSNPKFSFVSEKINSNRDTLNYGIEWESVKKLYQGWQTNKFKESAFPYRLIITVPFNPDIAAGKLINLEIYTAIPDVDGFSSNKYKVAPEYSGNWLILENRFIWSNQIPIPEHRLIIGRPKLSFNRENVNSSSFLS